MVSLNSQNQRKITLELTHLEAEQLAVKLRHLCVLDHFNNPLITPILEALEEYIDECEWENK
jgi:hypothetical protein